MENFIIILKNGEVFHSAGYNPILHEAGWQHNIDKLIKISNPTEPRILDKELEQWIRLKSIV